MYTFEALSTVFNILRPVLDVGILTFILYKAYVLLSKTNGIQVIKALVIIAIAYAVAEIFRLQTLLWLMNFIAPGLLMCFAVIFQPEIRKLFLKLGQSRWFAFGSRSKHSYVDAVLTAADMLAKQRRGMLAVFLRQTKHDDIMGTGTILNADVSSALLVTIYSYDSPLHDAACFIQNGKILAAGCFLPLSEQFDIKKTFGTRHRAGLGLSEVSDAVVLIVSEETGAISLAYDSELHYDLTPLELKKTLEYLLELPPDANNLEDTIDESKFIS
ncbi:MAG: diadenylate cyclase CdaA [Treponema sp.]|nr:diadenylate cyclase CdaA [Treponema sp.]